MPIRFKIELPSLLERVLIWPLIIYHTIRLGCPLRIIPLTKGKFAIVDPADYLWLSKFKWHVVTQNDYFYACRRASLGEYRPNRNVQMNREILNAPPGLLVDHRNHDTLDNRRENLRLATYAENGYNRRKVNKFKSSKYKGVSFRKKRNLWRATICTNGRSIQLGEFHDEISAAKAYDEAARLYYKEYACLNFPD